MCVSTPKVPKPTPVVQRQAYKDPASRASLSSGTDPSARMRVIAGVATSATGVNGPASTTKRVLAGGDQTLMPVLAGGGVGVGLAPVGGGSTNPTTPSGTGASGGAAVSDAVMGAFNRRRVSKLYGD